MFSRSLVVILIAAQLVAGPALAQEPAAAAQAAPDVAPAPAAAAEKIVKMKADGEWTIDFSVEPPTIHLHVPVIEVLKRYYAGYSDQEILRSIRPLGMSEAEADSAILTTGQPQPGSGATAPVSAPAVAAGAIGPQVSGATPTTATARPSAPAARVAPPSGPADSDSAAGGVSALGAPIRSTAASTSLAPPTLPGGSTSSAAPVGAAPGERGPDERPVVVAKGSTPVSPRETPPASSSTPPAAASQAQPAAAPAAGAASAYTDADRAHEDRILGHLRESYRLMKEYADSLRARGLTAEADRFTRAINEVHAQAMAVETAPAAAPVASAPVETPAPSAEPAAAAAEVPVKAPIVAAPEAVAPAASELARVPSGPTPSQAEVAAAPPPAAPASSAQPTGSAPGNLGSLNSGSIFQTTSIQAQAAAAARAPSGPAPQGTRILGATPPAPPVDSGSVRDCFLDHHTKLSFVEAERTVEGRTVRGFVLFKDNVQTDQFATIQDGGTTISPETYEQLMAQVGVKRPNRFQLTINRVGHGLKIGGKRIGCPVKRTLWDNGIVRAGQETKEFFSRGGVGNTIFRTPVVFAGDLILGDRAREGFWRKFACGVGNVTGVRPIGKAIRNSRERSGLKNRLDDNDTDFRDLITGAVREGVISDAEATSYFEQDGRSINIRGVWLRTKEVPRRGKDSFCTRGTGENGDPEMLQVINNRYDRKGNEKMTIQDSIRAMRSGQAASADSAE